MRFDRLKDLREELLVLEQEEGFCYRNRTSCTTTCPFYQRGAFDDPICLIAATSRAVKRLSEAWRLHP